ncbi:hypothetical protein [Iodobacter fluviatilis]|uniref:Uncharacterized protein n=1 Tax=Iodobacter fluviatilis TaxID=537 RepID=A0A7G3GFB5_9NEIS|nr:hypothetical protein [Iodobacter fluviatilis]QBC45874.1 hypothetical protein C1H71_20235 [Iodobacter fluviatilis]
MQNQNSTSRSTTEPSKMMDLKIGETVIHGRTGKPVKIKRVANGVVDFDGAVSGFMTFGAVVKGGLLKGGNV